MSIIEILKKCNNMSDLLKGDKAGHPSTATSIKLKLLREVRMRNLHRMQH